jgi:hypothetical protein
MERYRNLSGKSGVVAYETGEGYIKIQYVSDPLPYLYTDESAGPEHVAQMQKLANAGRGLGTYVSQHVKWRYVKPRK